MAVGQERHLLKKKKKITEIQVSAELGTSRGAEEK